MKQRAKNISASVHQRLLNKARESRRPFNELLQYFAIERFMYRLSKTPHVERFILKGALMLPVWKAPLTRPTKDIDLLGYLDTDVQIITNAFRDVCEQGVESDGMLFDADSVSGEIIMEEADYGGIRVGLQGSLGSARVSLQIDVGFGDVITPSASEITYPTILDMPPPALRGYSRESTVAEKFQAMVKLGALNSRMKDFYDIWMLSCEFNFEGSVLAAAITSTFQNRRTDVPKRIVPLEESFGKDPTKTSQWQGFISKSKLDNVPHSFAECIAALGVFLRPVAEALYVGKPFDRSWVAPGPWK
jgi:hypothetical protein